MTDERCRRCGSPNVLLTSYWGHPLCRPCVHHIVALCDREDRWPPVPWSEDDQDLLAAHGIDPDPEHTPRRST